MTEGSKKEKSSRDLFLAAGGIVTSCLVLEAFLAGTLTIGVVKGYLSLIFIPLAGVILLFGYKLKKRRHV